MIRIVVDASVLIRYLIRPSAAIRTLIEDHWLNDVVQMVTAPELVEELTAVLQRDYIRRLIQPDEGQALLDAIGAQADHLPALGTFPSYTRDSKDDKFVACALASRAEYILTVDQDLLVLASVGDVRIVTPEGFLALLRPGV